MEALFLKINENILTPVVEVMFVLAFLMFAWGMYQMISSAEDSEKRENGKNSILWSVIGMFIMVSVFGIIRLIANTLQVGDPFIR